MSVGKYFDHKASASINPQTDGCLLKDWRTQYGKVPFATHPSGFLIFLSPDELEDCDEFRNSDPYTFKSEDLSEFTSRRIDGTLTLIKDAVTRIGRPSLRLLDVGSGQGHITALIKELLPDAEISALDYSLSGVEYATKHYPGIDFIVASAYECPYVNEYFDIVVLNNIWEHVTDPLRMLSGVDKVLKRDGYIVISTPSRYHIQNLINILRGKPVKLISKYHITEYTVGQVIEQFRFGGYEVEKIYSKPIKEWGPKSDLAKRILSLFIRMIGSHHQLESTVFYLATPSDNSKRI